MLLYSAKNQKHVPCKLGFFLTCGECAEPRLAQKQESKEKEAEEKKEKNITKEVEDNVSLQSE